MQIIFNFDKLIKSCLGSYYYDKQKNILLMTKFDNNLK